MRARQSAAEALVALTRSSDASERLGSWRQAVAALGQSIRVRGPPPLDGVEPQVLAKVFRIALEGRFLDELDWITPGAATVALYELMIGLPPGMERRELGRRVLTRLYEGTASTFAAVATRMALGSGRGLEPAPMHARVSLVMDLPVGSGVDADALALSLALRRELADRWVVRPSMGALPARRLAALILEHAAREAVMRAREGDPLPREMLAGDALGPVRTRLLGDREPLVWRHAAVCRGLLAAADSKLREQIDLELDPALTPTEWRRAAVSLVATMVADPEGGLAACRALLKKSEIIKKDPGIVTTFVWGLPRVVEAEPDAAEALLELCAASRRPDVAESVAILLSEVANPTFGSEAAKVLRTVLASKLDSEPPALRSLTERTLAGLDRAQGDDGIVESVRRALVAFESTGARAAYELALSAIKTAEETTERLVELDLGDPASLPESLRLLADLDAGVIERGRLAELLLLGRRPGDSDASVPELDKLYDQLGSWLLDAEQQMLETENRLGALGNQRTLRALLHLVDLETTRGEADEVSDRLRARIRRALDVLVRRLAAGPEPSMHRIVCATLARAFDAAVREHVAEPSDIFLIVAEHLHERQSIQTLTEASTNEDVEGVLAAYSSFLQLGPRSPVTLTSLSGEISLDPDTLAGVVPDESAAAAKRMVRLSLGLQAGGAHRAEALRSTVLRLGRALETISVARGLSDLMDAGGQSVVTELEEATASLVLLAKSARRRLLGRAHDEPRIVGDVPSLSAVVEHAVRAGTAASADLVAAAASEMCADLGGSLALAILGVLQRLDTLPPVAPSENKPIPLERRRARLPDWLLPRRTIGAFYVVRALGSGGGSSVFVARRIEERHDPKSEAFALKVPQYDPTTARSISEQEFLQLFRDEAGALLSLPHHEHLARFVTFDLAARPKPILVMELIRGAGLDRLIHSKSLTTELAFDYLDGILAGLEAMHGVGVAHLDVKPTNVILREGQTAVLVDFGLSGRNLRPGCGTLDYAAPEVIGIVREGEPATPLPADIYAFGCTAFELLTGRHLFEADDETALMSKHLSHDGWPESLAALGRVPGLRDLSVVLAACLRRNPAERPKVAEVRTALRPIGQSVARARWPLGGVDEEASVARL